LKYLPLFLLTITSLLAKAQQTFKPAQIRPEILQLTSNFPDHNDTLPEKYLSAYNQIFKKATVNELYELTNHPKPLVRLSAFYQLLNGYSPKVVNLLQKNRADTSQYFKIQYGCIIEIHSFYDELLFYLSVQSGLQRHFKLSPAQKQFIATMLNKREQERREFIFNHNY
jgi:HEAT repeat protein